MRPIATVFICWLIGIYAKTSDRRLLYDVVRNGTVIGQIEAVKTGTGSQVEYRMESSVNFKLLMSFSVYSKVTGLFKDGMLMSGSMVRKVNGTERARTLIHWRNGHYQIEDKDETMRFAEKISYTTACLMHEEPSGRQQVFSEAYKKFLELKEVRPHYYELRLPDGNRNYYSYANGICVGAEVNTSYSKAFFRLRK